MAKKDESFVDGHGNQQIIPSLAKTTPALSVLTAEDLSAIQDVICKSFSPVFLSIDNRFGKIQDELSTIRKEQMNLSNHMVGWDRCAALRESDRKTYDQLFQAERTMNGEKFVAIDNKIEILFTEVDGVKKVCTEFKTAKAGLVTDAALARAEVRVTEKAEEKAKASDGEALRRLTVLENKVDGLVTGLGWLYMTRGVFQWFISNWKIIVPIVLFLMAMFGIVFAPVDWSVRDFQWATRPPVNITVHP